eukprot:m.359445 g.359445  ORF g.359445 m.359445 type:complete len:782 (+) comp55995_c0_seq3:35-2380(+)
MHETSLLFFACLCAVGIAAPEHLFPAAKFCAESFQTAVSLQPPLGVGIRIGSSIAGVNIAVQSFVCLRVTSKAIASRCNSPDNSWWSLYGGKICLNRDRAQCLSAQQPSGSAGQDSLVLSISGSKPHQLWNITEEGKLQLVGANMCLRVAADPSATWKSLLRVDLAPCSQVTDRAVIIHRRHWTLHPLSKDDLQRVTIFNASTVSRETDSVYLFASNGLELGPLTHEALFTDYAQLKRLRSINPRRMSLGWLPVQLFLRHKTGDMHCEFSDRKPNSPPLISNVRFLTNRITSVTIVCDLPKALRTVANNSLLESYTASLVIGEYVVPSNDSLQVLPPGLAVRHSLCVCLALWQRWSFLLEYLTYHTRLHGLAHTIIIAQDQETLLALPWLRTMFSIEAHYWPYLATQPGMVSYCSLLAKQQCEWVIQGDIDEFIFTEQGVSLLTILQSQPTNVFAISAERYAIQMFAHEKFLRNPVGGVIRNYLCRKGHQSSGKQIVRSDGLHETFANKVHVFAPANSSLQARKTVVTILHYAVQAWELYLLKYLRSADVGEGFNGIKRDSIDIEHPEPEYLSLARGCTSSTPWKLSRNQLWRRISFRGASSNRILVTGTHGELRVLDALNSAFLARSSSAHVTFSADLALKPYPPPSSDDTLFLSIFHVSMEPLVAISNLARISDWAPQETLLHSHMSSLDPVLRAMYHWVAVTQLLDMHVTRHVRLVDLHKHLAGDLDFLRAVPSAQLQEIQNFERLSAASVSWAQLRGLDGQLANSTCAMALHKGYTC